MKRKHINFASYNIIHQCRLLIILYAIKVVPVQTGPKTGKLGPGHGHGHGHGHDSSGPVHGPQNSP